MISHLLCWALAVNVVARVDAVERWRADGEAGGLLGLVVGGDARVGRLVAARLVVLRDDLVHGHAPGHHRLQQWKEEVMRCELLVIVAAISSSRNLEKYFRLLT